MKYVRQLDSMQCGVACLSMICNHYGKNMGTIYMLATKMGWYFKFC